MKDSVRRRLIFVILLILGILLRLWFARVSIAKPIFDQLDYLNLAEELRNGKWGINCCTRSFGYSFVLAILFQIFGNSLTVVYSFQIILEVITAVLLYLTTSLLTKNSRISLIAFSVYLLNPFTASYVGMILTEVWAIFLLSLLLYLAISITSYTQRRYGILFLSGVLLGLFIYTRVAFFWWGIIVLFGLPVLTFLPNKKKCLTALLFIGSGFLLISQYQIRANHALYNSWSPATARPGYIIDMYWNTIILLRPTLLSEIFAATTGKGRENLAFLQAMETPDYKKYYDIYKDKLILYIKENPKKYVFQRIKNIALIWHKRNLFYYTDPFMPQSRILSGILNTIYLGVSLFGIFVSTRTISNRREKIIFLFMTLSIFIYISLLFSLFTPEDRLTLVAYPFVFVYVGFGIHKILEIITSKLLMSTSPSSIA